jgi:hypothetical protein
MDKRNVLAAFIVTMFLAVAGTGIAAEGNMDSRKPPVSASENSNRDENMGGGMMGMKSMMENCPMMGKGMAALSPQQQMQMHAEMMQAMGRIMEKYASQAEPAAR